MIEIVMLTDTEFDALSARCPTFSWLQSSKKCTLDSNCGMDSQHLGFKDSSTQELIGGCRVTIHKAKIAPFGEALGGPLFVDGLDEARERAAYSALSAWAKEHKLTHIRVMPIEPYQTLDDEGKPIDENNKGTVFDAYDARFFEKSEARRTFYGALLDDYTGPRQGYFNEFAWMFVKDLNGLSTEDDLLASYSKNTRRNLKIAQKSCVTLEKLDAAQIDRFYAQYSMAREKHEFHDNRPLSYFAELLNSFAEHMELWVAYLDIAAYKASWEGKISEFEADIARLEKNLETARKPERIKKQLADATSKLESAQKRLEEAQDLEQMHGSRVDLAASLFVFYPHESIYYLSGSDPKFAHLYAQTLLQHHVMLEDIKRGIDRHNFYGISGYFGKEDEGYGVLSFKQGFGGYTVQLIGAGNVVGNSFTYRLKKLLKRGR